MFIPGRGMINAMAAGSMAMRGLSAAKGVFMGQYGRTAAGAAWGGAYGMASDDTSVLGGAAMGAGALRYLGAGALKAGASGRGIAGIGASAKAYGSAFGSGIADMAKKDFMRARVIANSAPRNARMAYRGARMAANKMANKVMGSYKSPANPAAKMGNQHAQQAQAQAQAATSSVKPKMTSNTPVVPVASSFKGRDYVMDNLAASRAARRSRIMGVQGRPGFRAQQRLSNIRGISNLEPGVSNHISGLAPLRARVGSRKAWL